MILYGEQSIIQFSCNKNVEKMKNNSEIEGLIFNIQRYSIHDGPGIRTIVFLKGCPMVCPWCSNPESQSFEIEQMGNEQVGRIVSVDDVMNIVKRDKPFYKKSGGGLTISGGEPLMQPTFTKELIDEAHNNDINVAVETSGFQKWEIVKEILKIVDYILYDIKIMDSKLHKEILKVNNDLILQNIKKLSCLNKQIVVRVPIIPGYNDSYENLYETAEFCHNNRIKELHFLPYHQFGVHKYKKLNREYTLNNIEANSKETILNYAKEIQDKYDIIIKVH